MKIAIPVTEGRLSPHFGHCEQFVIFDVDDSSKQILDQKILESPPHSPGMLPRWLASEGANVIIAGGMGSRAIDLFDSQNITVVIGAPAIAAQEVVEAYLKGNLEDGQNVCDH